MPAPKGKSQHPGGRVKDNVGAYNLPAVCRINSREAIDTVLKIMRNEDAVPQARLKAAEMLLDRGYGKAAQVTIQPSDMKTALELTDAELASIATGSGSGDVGQAQSPSTTH